MSEEKKSLHALAEITTEFLALHMGEERASMMVKELINATIAAAKAEIPVDDQSIRLMAGELNAEEMVIAKAVMNGAANKVKFIAYNTSQHLRRNKP